MGYEVDSTPGDEGIYWSEDQCSYCNADLVRRLGDEHYGLEFRTCVVCAPHVGEDAGSAIVPDAATTPSEIERRRAKQALVASGTW
jgi:hypothetical protein